jgi:hypothetical protein
MGAPQRLRKVRLVPQVPVRGDALGPEFVSADLRRPERLSCPELLVALQQVQIVLDRRPEPGEAAAEPVQPALHRVMLARGVTFPNP